MLDLVSIIPAIAAGNDLLTLYAVQDAVETRISELTREKEEDDAD